MLLTSTKDFRTVAFLNGYIPRVAPLPIFVTPSYFVIVISIFTQMLIGNFFPLGAHLPVIRSTDQRSYLYGQQAEGYLICSVSAYMRQR